MNRLAAFALFALCLVSLPAITGASRSTSSRAREIAKSRYTKPHSLGDSYTFDPRDGWQSFNASNLQHNYPRGSTKNDKKKTSFATPKLSFLETLSRPVSKLVGMLGMKGEGESQAATVTWYTGHDLLNPSCWANTKWTPTDESFICALTLQGWNNKPQCFKFLEVCHSPLSCIFVRVADTCLGCAPQSHHIDLTKGAFTALANPSEGLLQMNFRTATDPIDEWFEELWGPKE
ncbi:hypothetical protein K438DRAFT_1806898 [Mycena galopus ATCC 62051]|nr:hypothetical protein K438DRAFT_1806898 [Mycena galopus ATCC 62051]